VADLLTAPAAPTVPGERDDRGRAMLALARVESVRLLRHPLTLAAMLLFLSPWIYTFATGSAGRFPVLHEQAVTVQVLGLFVLGSGALMTANLAAMRGHRHHTGELYSTLVLPPPWRTAAMLLALLPYGLVVALVVVARLGVLALRPGAVGHPGLAEIVTTPAVILLWGAIGVLLARLARTAIAAPLALVLLLVLMFTALVVSNQNGAWMRYLMPIMVDDRQYSLPAALVDRPAGRHLLYVIGLIAVVTILALARSGARRVLVPLIVAVALTATAGAVQYHTDPALDRLRADVTRDPASIETCRQLGAVQYCALGEFETWIPFWAEVLQGVLRPAPPGSGPPLVVRQRIWVTGRPDGSGGFTSSADADAARVTAWQHADTAAGHPGAIEIGTDWGPDTASAGFAAAAAYRVLSGTPFTTGRPVCGARGALLVWLVGQATPGTALGLSQLDANSWGAITFPDASLLTSLSVPDRDAAPALTLLGRPAQEVTPAVREHWQELTDPATPLERFGTLLGVPVPPAPPAEERVACGA
jgi:hypothetical protein